MKKGIYCYMGRKLGFPGLCVFMVLLSLVPARVFAQYGAAGGDEGAAENLNLSRGSIPEELLRPRRGEAPRYPVDTVIGQLGPGKAPRGAYLFAREALSALVAGNKDAPSLSAMNRIFLDDCLGALGTVSPRSFRIGSGREEPDGAVSFLVRFIGREQGIVGELFVRQGRRRVETRTEEAAAVPAADAAPVADAEDTAVSEGAEEQAVEPAAPPPPPATTVGWIFDDLILEEARDRETENAEGEDRFDFSPYERFF
jgi:hypothetical protein